MEDNTRQAVKRDGNLIIYNIDHSWNNDFNNYHNKKVYYNIARIRHKVKKWFFGESKYCQITTLYIFN